MNPDVEVLNAPPSEAKAINAFRGRKATTGSMTSDYYSLPGDGPNQLDDFRHDHRIIPEPLSSENESDMDYGFEKLELNDKNTAS